MMPGAVRAAPAPENDYSQPQAWICLPGHVGACDRDLSVTEIKADGTFTLQPFKADPDAPIDCLYLYPTASKQPTGNSDLTPGEKEKGAAWVQFGRFAKACRLYAPMYRSVTLAGAMGAPTTSVDRDLAYRSVRDAWTYYLAHYNHGRRVVLIGHSQGAQLWGRLLHEEIDGKPQAHLIASAILMGEPSIGPRAPFKSFPACVRLGELGCVVRYASFRAGQAPSQRSLFANSQGGCVNPANLAGGEAELHPIFLVYIRKDEQPWVDTGAHVATPFVSMPAMLSGQCVQAGDRDFLSITVHWRAGDHRVRDIGGDMVINGKLDPAWGLHGVEPNLAMDDLIGIVRAQGQAVTAGH